MSENNQQNHRGSFYSSIGIGSIVENKRKINKVLREVSFAPDFVYEREKDKKGRIFYDRYKYLGSGFGVSVKGYRCTKPNKEGKMVEKHTVTDWAIFAKGSKENIVKNAYVDMDEDEYGFCLAEDKVSANLFEFRINNMMEILDHYKKLSNQEEVNVFEVNINQVNVALLMLYGTVLLPVDKSCECCQGQRDEEEREQKELASKARMGDFEAEAAFYQLAYEQEMELGERLAEEDFLSVFEGYYFNMVEQSGIFTILGDILDVEELTNHATNEQIYRLTLSITDTYTTAYINKKDLLGFPTAGMRLMGVGMLQGDVLLK